CSSLPPFASWAEYEDHYSSMHTRVCNECRRVLPTLHLLDLHLCEIHDSFFAVMAQKKKSYRCYVDDCAVLSTNPKERIGHLTRVHGFPPTFHFNVILGQDARADRKQRLEDAKHQAHPEARSDRPAQTSGSVADGMDVDGLTAGMAQLMVPRSIQFGGKKKKAAMSFRTVGNLYQENAPKTTKPSGSGENSAESNKR
ncbi:hypothetical protein HDU91_002279, partial [Kappamyces sp. JEL0680]